jgi:hypothetical protein
VSTGKILVELPARACWWIKFLAEEAGVTARHYLQVVVLRHLAETPGVDLSRSPESLKGGSDGCKESSTGTGNG